jgi:hypothetical protein
VTMGAGQIHPCFATASDGTLAPGHPCKRQAPCGAPGRGSFQALPTRGARGPVIEALLGARSGNRHRGSKKTMKSGQKCDHIVQTLGQVAAAFGVSVRTAQGWSAMGIPGRRGAWDLLAIAAWLYKRDRERRERIGGDDLHNWPLRLKRAQAIKAESAAVARTEHDRLIREARAERDIWFAQVFEAQVVVLPGLLAHKPIDEVRAELQRRRDEVMATGYGNRQA